MDNVMLAEGMAVMGAILSGRCEKCPIYYECKSNDHFKFPEDAYCMKTKDKLLKKWGYDDGN